MMQPVLVRLGAPIEFQDWADAKGLLEIWQECPRGDWMMGMLVPVLAGPKLSLAALDCAEPALKFCRGPTYAIRNAVTCLRNWAKGMAGMPTLTLAIQQANAENTAAATMNTTELIGPQTRRLNEFARYAVLSACHSAVTPPDAQNAVYAAGECSEETSLAVSADRIRARFTMEEVQHALGV